MADAISNSIDIRDLLPTVDPSGPLTAPDLHLIITHLNTHSSHIKSRVQSYLAAHSSDFSRLFSLAALSSSQSLSLSSQLSHLLDDNDIDVEIKNVVKEIEMKVKEVREKKEVLEVVRGLERLCEELKGVSESIRRGDFVKGGQMLKELKSKLRVDDEVGKEGEEPIVYGLLKNEWLQCFEEIQEVLAKFMENAVQFEKESNTVRVKFQLSVDGIQGVELPSVLEAMDVVGIMDYGLAKLADLIIKYLISPAVNSGSPVSFVEEPYKDSKQMTEATIKIIPSADPKNEEAAAVNICAKIIQVLNFIHKNVCLEKDHWMLSLGRLTWPRISDLIISNILSKVVPDDASKLADFQMVIKVTSDFENALKEMDFISATDDSDKRLSEFAENVEVHFASRKKTEILAKARNFLLQCDFALPQEYTGRGPLLGESSDRIVDLIFLSERCVVSEAALHLVKLVHQTLEDICVSSPKVALEFYHAVRDALLLYEAVVPIKLERQLDGINQVAVLIHNDCLYFSQEIAALAFEYRANFPNSLKEHAVFVDMSLKFSSMAEEILQRQIQLVCLNLKEAVDGADGFQNTHQIKEYESAKFSIDQVIFILEKVRILWEPLLLPLTYAKSMCMVLESVLSRITKEILFLDDIAAEETLQLQRLIQLLLENILPLLESLNAINQKENVQKSSSVPLVDVLIPSLCKIRRLADLLDMPLKLITSAWESGELVSCGFTLSEVKDFIQAIFADSPLRKECLWRIESAC